MKDYWELWFVKAIGCSELNELLCERNVNCRGLVCEASGGSKDFIRAICVVFVINNLWLLISWS